MAGVILNAMSASKDGLSILVHGTMAITGAFNAAGTQNNGLVISASDANPSAQTKAGTFYSKNVAGSIKPYFIGAGGSAVDLSSGGGGAGAAAGSDTQIQYNNGGDDLGGAADLTYADGTGDVTVGTSTGDAKLKWRDDEIYIFSPRDGAVDFVNTDGTSNHSILLSASAGGIEIQVADEKALTMGNKTNDAYFKVAASNTAGNEQVHIVNTVGTSATEGTAAIQLTATAGGINLKSSLDNNNAILLTADGGTDETIKIHVDQGTGSDSLTLVSDAGGIDIDATAGPIDLLAGTTMTIKGATGASFGDDTGTWEFDGSGAVTETGMTSLSATPSGAITLTAGAASTWSTSAGALVIDGAAGLTLDSDGTDAVNLGTEAVAKAVTVGNAATAEVELNALLVDINAGTNGLTMNAAGASNLVTSAGALTITSDEAATWSTVGGKLTIKSGDAGEDIGISGQTTTLKGLLNVDEAATFDSTVTVAGNLLVQGTTTTVSSSNLVVKDPIAAFGIAAATQGGSATPGPVGDRGFVFPMETASAGSPVFFWDNSGAVSSGVPQGTFRIAYADSSGSASSITKIGALGLDVGAITTTGVTDSALTDNRVVIAGTSGVLEDSSNLTFDGSDLALGSAIGLVFGAAGEKIEGDGDNLNITSGGELDMTVTGLIDINGSANLDVDITGTVDVLASSTFSIDGTGASNVTATSGNLTVSTATSGNVVVSSAGTVDVDADGGALSLDGSGGINIGTEADVAIDVDSSTFDLDASGALTMTSTTMALDPSSTYDLDAAGAITIDGASVTVGGDGDTGAINMTAGATSTWQTDTGGLVVKNSGTAGSYGNYLLLSGGFESSIVLQPGDKTDGSYATTIDFNRGDGDATVGTSSTFWSWNSSNLSVAAGGDYDDNHDRGMTTVSGTMRFKGNSTGNTALYTGAGYNFLEVTGSSGNLKLGYDSSLITLANKTLIDGTNYLKFYDDGDEHISADGSGNLTVNAGADITYNAAGADHKFQNNGTQQWAFSGGAAAGFKMNGTADTGDYFFISVGAAGLTNITTTDDDGGAAAHLQLNADGDLRLQADQFVKIFDDSSNTVWRCDVDNNFTQLYAPDATDVLKTLVEANAATTVSTSDADGTLGHYTLDIDGDIILDADGGTIDCKDAGTSQFQIEFGSSTVDLYAQVSDEAMRLRINDGGSARTCISLVGDSAVGSTTDIELGHTGMAAGAFAMIPKVDNVMDLGGSNNRFRNVYTGDLHLANNRGNYTLVEEEEMLTIRNNRTGKWYKLAMEEIDPTGRDEGMNGSPPLLAD